MKLDDIVPILVMIVYVAVLLLKRRRSKGVTQTKPVAPKKVSDTGSSVPGLFSKLIERLKTFFSELEQQFRIEAEKVRIKNLEPDNSLDIVAAPDEASDPLLKEIPDIPMVARGKKRVPGQQIRKKKAKFCRSGVDIRLCRQKIRSAVVWSEILAPPLALRGEKKPWDI